MEGAKLTTSFSPDVPVATSAIANPMPVILVAWDIYSLPWTWNEFENINADNYLLKEALSLSKKNKV